MKFRITQAADEKRIRINADPLADIPVLPDNLRVLTPAWLIRWAEWVAAGRPDVEAQQTTNTLYVIRGNDWNPALHPRDPRTGKFVERGFSLPNDAPEFDSMGVKGTLEYLDEQGEDIDSILDPESGVTIDGVPNDATSVDDVPDNAADSFEDIESPSEARNVATNRIESAVEGTTASLENMDKRQAKTLTENVEKLAEANPEFFNGVEEIRDHDLNATASAAYDPGQNALVFGPSSMSGNEAYEDYLARNSGAGTVAHEVGHAAHYGDSGDDIFDYYFWPEGVTQDEIDQIESEVSEYAAESPEEFVAEAFSVLADGGELSERTREIYDELNGPAYNT